MGTPALTIRGFREGEFLRVAELFNRAVHIAVRLRDTEGWKKMKGFKETCVVGSSIDLELVRLRREISNFASSLLTVRFEEEEMDFWGGIQS
jgi:glycine hydroxymethyltransferase